MEISPFWFEKEASRWCVKSYHQQKHFPGGPWHMFSIIPMESLVDIY